MKAWQAGWVLVLLGGCQPPAGDAPRAAASGTSGLAAVPADIAHRLRINYENRLELLGYDLSPGGGLRSGARTELTLYWKCLHAPEPGWTLVAHLLDDAARLLPVKAPGLASPSEWQAGKVYVDHYQLEVPPGLTGRVATLVVGVEQDVSAPSSKDDSPASVEHRLRVVSGPSAGPGLGLVARITLEPGERPAPSAGPVPSAAPPDLRALFEAFRK